MALHKLRKSYEICGLITTITEDYGRVSMHGVRVKLLEEQASSLDIPLYKVLISKKATNQEYEDRMRDCLLKLKTEGVTEIAHGDIFLQDVKDYRERMLRTLNMKGLFPLWGMNTRELVTNFINLGFKAVTVCIDPRFLDASFCGRMLDKSFLDALPPKVDPCGENGEFHTFVYDGPTFSHPINWAKGDVVKRDSFYFCDLIPS